MLVRWPKAAIFAAGVYAGAWSYVFSPFPPIGAYEALDLIAAYSPRIYTALVFWHIVTPPAGTWLAGYVGLTVWRVWGESGRKGRHWGALPAWPQDPTDEAPSLVVGEVHHPVEPRQVGLPSWLTLPEKGLYTGVAIFGAVGTGKTSACMYPFAEQLLSWQGDNPRRRAAALILEVKGDFCYQVQDILGPGRSSRRLRRDRNRNRAPVESPERHLARSLLPGVHDFQSPQSALRQRQGAILAAGIHEPSPLDHRSAPVVRRGRRTRLGDAAGHLPLRHRPRRPGPGHQECRKKSERHAGSEFTPRFRLA